MQVRTWKKEVIALPEGGTHYGFVWQGEAKLRRSQQTAPFPLTAGMYFSIAEAATVGGDRSTGFIVTHLVHTGRFQLGGPIASTGRFAYIDGGLTSLLIGPVAKGDPCLHALYMPAGVEQTVHSHPSDRIGLIIQGEGYCVADKTRHALRPGVLFHIPPNQPHQFCTGQPLLFIVFHPDSDIGFSDRNHPMLRRTFVNNISATDIPEIQTPLRP